jgi:hypothetical protein
MKKLALLFAAVLVAGVAVADEKPATASKATTAAPADKPAADKPAAGKVHNVEAEIVSIDAEKHTLTIKGETENKTVPVEGKAIAALKHIKPGKATLACRDDASGNHQAVIAIKPAGAEKPEAK